MGLIARGLQMAGYETVVTTWNAGIGRMANPPRMTITRLDRGQTIGKPNDSAQQRRVLEATLALLAQDAPIKPVQLSENLE